jgi:hypothetical protein
VSVAPVGKRRFHVVLSHAHVDKDQADHLLKWLQEVAGMPVWYDAVNMPPGATIAQALPEAIENSRSMTLLLSKQSATRGWVQQEFNAAINHQTRFRTFRIIPVRPDDVSPPGFLHGSAWTNGPRLLPVYVLASSTDLQGRPPPAIRESGAVCRLLMKGKVASALERIKD